MGTRQQQEPKVLHAVAGSAAAAAGNDSGLFHPIGAGLSLAVAI